LCSKGLAHSWAVKGWPILVLNCQGCKTHQAVHVPFCDQYDNTWA
jgi:hypothetical protein